MARKSNATASVINADEYDYKRTKVRGKDGALHYSRNNGDAIAKAFQLLKVQGKDMASVARDNKLGIKRDDYKNQGQFAMAISNRIRAKVKRGEAVRVGSVTVNSLKQRVDVPAAA